MSCRPPGNNISLLRFLGRPKGYEIIRFCIAGIFLIMVFNYFDLNISSSLEQAICFVMCSPSLKN
jgi:hypothetical protein